VAYAPNYQSLLDQAITLDNNIRKEENRKRKFRNSKTHIEPFYKKHHSYEGNGNGSNSNGHKHNGGFKENHSNGHHNGGNGHHDGNNGHHNGGNGQHRSNSMVMKNLSTVTRYKCKKTRHYANRCPENKSDETAKPSPFQKGHVNHINVEEVMGTFPLNSLTTLVLFDTRASHSFISRAYVSKHAFSHLSHRKSNYTQHPRGKRIRYKSYLEFNDTS
jgi:hypothetical protein